MRLVRNSKEWNYFIALVDSNVDACEALKMTREKFPLSLVDQMNQDLKRFGIEKDA